MLVWRLSAVASLVILTSAAGKANLPPVADKVKAPAKTGATATSPAMVQPVGASAAQPGRGGSCYGDFANPAGSNGFIAADGKLLYLLAAKPTEVPGATAGEKASPASPKVNGITLFRIDLTTNSATAVLAVKQRPNSILVNHGDPIKGISALSFPVVPGGCSEGKASGVNLGFDKKEGSASTLGKGSYGVVRSSIGTLVVDLDRRSVLETDVQSFQTRTSIKYGDGELPLFFDLGDRHLVSWNTKARGLSLLRPGKKDPDQKILVKIGDRVIQDGDRFMVMTSDRVTNTISVRMLPKWSKVDKDSVYSVKIPGAYNVADAQVEVNVAQSLIAVSAIPGPQRMRWQKIFLYNLKTGQLITTIAGTSSQYFEFFGLDRAGGALLAEVRNLTDKTSVEIRKFDLKTKKETTIKLAGP